MLTFSDLITEVKHRATNDQGGTEFDTPVKNAINSALFRLNRDALWRSMRRKTTFNTITSYTTGSGAGTFTEDSADIVITGATFITDNIKIGQRITLSGSSKTFTIKEITAETEITLDMVYDGDDTTTGTYTILAQEEYNLPVQVGHRMFLWHERWGFPFKLEYITDQTFYDMSPDNTEVSVPTSYRMWGEDMVDTQLLEASVIQISSSSTSDTSISVTVFGIVSGYPDYEIIITNASNGTTAVNGSKSFTSVERVVKSSSSATVGRITATANTTATTVAVLPVGNTTAGFIIRKIQLVPLPDEVFPINVQYYKEVNHLVSDGDVHELGQDFNEAIVLLATSKLKYSTNQDEADKFFALYKDELRSLKRTNMDKIDFSPKFRRPFERGDAAVHPQLLYRQAGANYGPSEVL